jgi:predicted RNA-binding protein Jag
MADPRLDTIKQLLEQLTFKDVELETSESDGHTTIHLKLPETDSGALIGYHGEKIDALQLIVNLIWN